MSKLTPKQIKNIVSARSEYELMTGSQWFFIVKLTKLLQPVQNTKILVGNLANQAKSALKIHKKKDAGYEK